MIARKIFDKAISIIDELSDTGWYQIPKSKNIKHVHLSVDLWQKRWRSQAIYLRPLKLPVREKRTY